MFICEISIISILICQKLGSVGSVQQKVRLPSHKLSSLKNVKILICINFYNILCGFDKSEIEQ